MTTSVTGFIRDHAAVIIGVLAIMEGFLCAYLLRRNDDLRTRLYRAREAAEDSARAAAMSAPGGIDPEVIIHLLRTGQPATLDVVHQIMEQRERSEQGRALSGIEPSP